MMELTAVMVALYSFIIQDTMAAARVCSENLKWKLYLSLTRVACLLGWNGLALKVR